MTRLIAPAGQPGVVQRARRRRRACAGSARSAFSTTVLPNASGVATARVERITGAFQGAMPTTTPAGWRTANESAPGTSEGITSPPARVGLRGRLAQHARREVAVEHPPAERRRRTSSVIVAGDLPARAPSAGRPRRSAARAACPAAVSAHSRNAACAASTARSRVRAACGRRERDGLARVRDRRARTSPRRSPPSTRRRSAAAAAGGQPCSCSPPGSSLSSSASTRCATANAAFAAGTPQ